MRRFSTKAHVISLWSLLLAMVPAHAQPAPLAIPFQALAQPDAALNGFLDDMRAKLARGDKAAINALFAPSVRVFQRGLDPFHPWKETEPVMRQPLETLSRLMFEEGAIPGAAPVDYSGHLVELLGEAFAPGAPLGKMPQIKNGVCSPPRYAVDADKIRQLAKKFDSLPVSIHVAPRPLALKVSPAPDATSAFTAATGTALVVIPDAGLPEGWARVAVSDGRRGYTDGIEDTPTLNRRHICLGKAGETYRIIAVFTYGL